MKKDNNVKSRIITISASLSLIIIFILLRTLFAIAWDLKSAPIGKNPNSVTASLSLSATQLQVQTPIATNPYTVTKTPTAPPEFSRPESSEPIPFRNDIIYYLVVSFLFGLIYVLLSFIARPLIKTVRIWLELEKPPTRESYSKKLAKLLNDLQESSSEVDNVLAELDKFAREREAIAQKVEADLEKLTEREQLLQKRIQELSNIPIPIAEYFSALLAQGEKRSAWRDYILFGAGFILSTITAIILRLLGLG
jgi:hypothetical protein